MCRLLGVSTSGYHAWVKRQPSHRAETDAALTADIRAAHAASRGTYGAPRIHAELMAKGIRIGRKRVARLMRQAGLAGVSRRRFVITTVKGDSRRTPDLVERNFTAEGPDRLWVADITYIPTWAGFLYLAVVLDAYSRRIVGCNVAKSRILKKLAGIKIVKTRSALCEIGTGRPRKGAHEAFKYAPLEEIDRHLRPLLAEEEMDLSYSDEPQEDGRIRIRGRLKHLPSGHYEDSFMPAPPDTSGGKSNVQAVGSTNCFLRRYIACNIFNIVVVGDDDDGTGGTIDEAQTKTILDLIKRAKAGPKFLKYMKAQSIEDAGSLEAAVATIAARDYRKAVSTLEQQIAKAEASRADLSSRAAILGGV
jgi:hypothetical protein